MQRRLEQLARSRIINACFDQEAKREHFGLTQIEHFNGQVEHTNTARLLHFYWLARGNILAYVEFYYLRILFFPSRTGNQYVMYREFLERESKITLSANNLLVE